MGKIVLLFWCGYTKGTFVRNTYVFIFREVNKRVFIFREVNKRGYIGRHAQLYVQNILHRVRMKMWQWEKHPTEINMLVRLMGIKVFGWGHTYYKNKWCNITVDFIHKVCTYMDRGNEVRLIEHQIVVKVNEGRIS